MTFLTINNGVITGLHDGDIEADFYGTPYYGHERVQVPDDTIATPGESADFYDKNWKRISDLDLISAGKMQMPTGYKVSAGKIIEMSKDEKITAGILPVPDGMKITKGKLVPQTTDEQFQNGLLSEDEYTAIKESDATTELNRRLSELMIPEYKARAMIDKKFANDIELKISELLQVRDQSEWPLNITWPK